MKAPKRTSSNTKTNEDTFEEIPQLDNQAADLLEQRLYERILRSYENHRHTKQRKIHVWKAAALWIGALLLTGAVIWKIAPTNPTISTEKVSAQLFSSTEQAKKITLSDSTVVILRPHSTLQVSTDYNRKDRHVTLEGNAFFEVTESPQKPFIVHSKHLTTRVLGTRFAVNSPTGGGEHSVYLEEGKVNVQIGKEQQQNLVPHERIAYQENTQKWKITKLNKVNLHMQNGYLTLDGADLSTLRQCLADYYKISLKNLTDKAERVHYKITLTPHMHIADIASLLSTITAREATIKDQTITIK